MGFCRPAQSVKLARTLGLADGLSVAVQSAAWSTALEVFSKSTGELSECWVSPMGVVPALDVLKYGHPGFVVTTCGSLQHSEQETLI